MALKVYEFPEDSSMICLLKSLAEGALNSAKKFPEKWWPKRMNNYPVDNLSAETCTLILENNNRHKVEFFYWNDGTEIAWSIVEETFTPSTSKDFYLLLP